MELVASVAVAGKRLCAQRGYVFTDTSLPASQVEKSYIQSLILSGPPLRLDGRSLEDCRPSVTIAPG